MLNRRSFLALTGVTGLSSLAAQGVAAQQAGTAAGREHYELQAYEVETDAQRDGLVSFMGEAAIPAMNRLGITPVGVFLPVEELSPVYVLIPHASAESAATLIQRLLADPEFLDKGAPFLNAPAAAPAFKRLQSSLLVAFTGMPHLEVPTKGLDRVFQLRTYESASVKAGQKKIEMFNTAEIAIFRKVGLNPVFFGEALIGAKMPNLTYMLGFDNSEAQKAAWSAFSKDPDWLKLRAIPEYADKEIVSDITNTVLKPAASSQI